MECEISCKDVVIVRTEQGKGKREETIHLEVESGGYWGYKIRIYTSGYMGLCDFPTKAWADIKDTIDRLIIKHEHLSKEDC